MRVSWLGLGAMGWPMAQHLVPTFDAGVWNRTATVAAAHAERYGTRQLTLTEALDADVVLTCLPTTAEVEQVAKDAWPSLRPGTVWVDCTSGDPAHARVLAEDLAGVGVTYLDAPVSGGTSGAEAGTLAVMVGGNGAALDRVRPVIETFAGTIVRVGEVGAGHAVKAINNTLLAANIWAAAEGLLALVGQGIDPAVALEVINASSGRSFASENTIGIKILSGDDRVTFRLGLLSKDTGIGMVVLEDSGTPAPVLRAVRELVRAAENERGGGADHTELVRLLEGWAGRELRTPAG